MKGTFIKKFKFSLKWVNISVCSLMHFSYPLLIKFFYSPSSLMRRGFFWQWLLSDSPVDGSLILLANGHRYWVAGGVGGILWKFCHDRTNGWCRRQVKNRASIPLAPCMLTYSAKSTPTPQKKKTLLLRGNNRSMALGLAQHGNSRFLHAVPLAGETWT